MPACLSKICSSIRNFAIDVKNIIIYPFKYALTKIRRRRRLRKNIIVTQTDNGFENPLFDYSKSGNSSYPAPEPKPLYQMDMTIIDPIDMYVMVDPSQTILYANQK